MEEYRQVELSIAKRNIQATVTLWNESTDANELDPENLDFVRCVNIEMSDLRSYVAYFAKAVFNRAGTPRWDDNQLILVKDISDDIILAAISTILEACEEDLAFDTETNEDVVEGEEGPNPDEPRQFTAPPKIDPQQTEYTIMNRLHTAMALVWLTADENTRTHESLRRDMSARIERVLAMGGSTFTR